MKRNERGMKRSEESEEEREELNKILVIPHRTCGVQSCYFRLRLENMT
jgi:hypothetical protein